MRVDLQRTAEISTSERNFHIDIWNMIEDFCENGLNNLDPGYETDDQVAVGFQEK